MEHAASRESAPGDGGAAPEGRDARALRGVAGTGLVGLYGRPYVSLERHLDLSALDAVHDEVCLALAQIPVDYTGGSHRSMGIMPPGFEHEGLRDYGEVLRSLDEGAFETFCALSDDPTKLDREALRARDIGEERSIALSRRQMLWLKYRHGVYFPWKVYVELMPNRWWSEKANPEGKRFTRIAETLFAKTLAFVRTLPFVSIGRCNIMGLEAHDHGTVHRDGEPASQQRPDPFITFCPAGNKALYLYDPRTQARTRLEGRAYWFNDHDYHGVESAPFFRYSIRVDGVFREDFVRALERDLDADETATT